jgi:xylan 1,4-beta-xylosidase
VIPVLFCSFVQPVALPHSKLGLPIRFWLSWAPRSGAAPREGHNDATGTTGSPIDFFTIHVYARHPSEFSLGNRPNAERIVENILQEYADIARRYGYENLEIIADEWGASSNGFSNTDQYPELIFRETEYFPAFFVRMVDVLIRELPRRNIPLTKMMICLSGQHNLERDFEGYRSFFTLNEYPKPIYNGYALMAKLGDSLLHHVIEQASAGIGVIPTKNEQGHYKIALYYTDDDFNKQLENRRVTLNLEGLRGRYRIRHYRLDHTHSNAYTKFKELGSPAQPNQLQREAIQQAGKLALYYPEYEVELNGHYEEHIVLTGHALSFIELEPLFS